ncbi:hypothetical protein mru_1175 [Methanobrevibacter ruminantium M1]|uniref:Uncharacterized protein n=1 Tax=Methanobrevibacter ruminantium (strain ATCC 35063 / DSM 1093 / JCM 13430 / OCM 146 / M1) TaxID=634498 RepID=D3E3B4_METRM|nr:hypothetical protein [Methanobrevibacter ruminantium]ADC47025.1 hypothetical protein mru_1175 [Methanobrevibacter ruminantium M1]
MIERYIISGDDEISYCSQCRNYETCDGDDCDPYFDDDLYDL